MDHLPHIDPDRPVLIAGPTASGKSALALEIAARQGGVIVNADALQVFDGWRVLTARPSAIDEAAAPHRLYGHVPYDGDYSVGHWLREVAPLLIGPARPIIVGGTGLYFTALTEGLADIPPTPPAIRAEADRRVAAEGHAGLLAELDAPTRDRVDQLNPVRVQRAWEVLRATGRGLAAWQDDTPPPLLPLHLAQAFVIDADRDWLAERIDCRFDLMLDHGALDEARAMLPRWNPAYLSSKAIGAPELIAHLRGEMTLEAATEAAKIASRQYAKRQRTWFRARMKAWHKLVMPG
ncbi:tRNA (adenosine(37)-N6)-dimethylallyltransferase MiaA [Actibacterium sp. XHP0104]|uniref:tRNA (adenosine(37)-N6)-dimethylallyltransferase MiaA n=1 Tax=Actibacterium sp. XHP0104 TaxID=2984335 RepID=UPI0021E7AA14|nr:tRNA (adenosine(37)-N6)-dimethylallyltransferase MiaA [Actibacterium sp. XHP0104]MCV2881141.1 tRNA (adenosine(37)-N6)-dimethylallyltransferase MiaA [Actibacterium sp. XHP0104]